MAFLTPEQKSSFGGAINFFGYVLAICVMIALASKFILSGYPPVIAFLEPFNELIIVIGAAALGVVVYSNNKLVK
jgi:amino acid transporter